MTDGLGNLARVIEDPTTLAYETNYSYDVLENLTQVSQIAGAVSQLRHFYYDAASRLTSADNPESGTIGYEYDANGNLTSKTDARGIEVNYFYDGLNRVIRRTYTAPSPAPDAYSATSNALYFYDGKGVSPAPDYSLGKLTKVANDESETLYTKFDVAGRVIKSQQITDGLDVCSDSGPACKMTYQYNLAGMLTQETYPSGRLVNQNYGADGKLTAVSSRLAVNKANKSYAQNFTYNAVGDITGMQLGNMRWESTTFNSRLQPTKIALGTLPGDDDLLNLVYTYGTSANSYHDNNGDVLTQVITVNNIGSTPGFVATQAYTYDALSRLKSATENSAQNGGSSSQSWKQTYLFDRFGNRTFDISSGATTTLPGSFDPDIYNPTINPATNQFNDEQGYVYDTAGSVKQDASGKKFVYDGENKQTSFGTAGDDDNGGTYVYDGDGQRVKKVVGTEVEIFVYDAFEQLVAEYSTTAPVSPNVHFLTADTLSTPRINTNADGLVISRHDYMPFEEDLMQTGLRSSGLAYQSDAIRQKFTHKERDDETGLDYFEARYYSSVLARFTTPDDFSGGATELFAEVTEHNPTFYSDIAEPQSLNKYQYALNNPLKFIDPDGHQATVADSLLWGAPRILPPLAIPGVREVAIAVGVTGVVAVGIRAIPGDATAGDGSCPSCERALNAGQSRMEKQGPNESFLGQRAEILPEVKIDGTRHPEAARHAKDAQKSGQPKVVEVGSRSEKPARRRDATRGHGKVRGKDRDEYPPAWSKQGGRGASVRPISRRDNRGSGASMGNQIRRLPPGSRVRIRPINVPKKKKVE